MTDTTTLRLCECCALKLSNDDDTACSSFHQHTHAPLDVPAGTVISSGPVIWDRLVPETCDGGAEDHSIGFGQPYWIAETSAL